MKFVQKAQERNDLSQVVLVKDIWRAIKKGLSEMVRATIEGLALPGGEDV